MTDDTTKMIVAQDGPRLKRAFHDWDTARAWRDAVSGDYALTEVLLIEEIPERLRANE